jgi:hypothetical protein
MTAQCDGVSGVCIDFSSRFASAIYEHEVQLRYAELQIASITPAESASSS